MMHQEREEEGSIRKEEGMEGGRERQEERKEGREG